MANSVAFERAVLTDFETPYGNFNYQQTKFVKKNYAIYRLLSSMVDKDGFDTSLSSPL